MSQAKDYSSTRDADFDGWLGNVTGYVAGKVSHGEWTHIPADKVTELKRRATDLHTLFRNTQAPHTPADTQAKNNARRAATRRLARLHWSGTR
ncbi:MAG: hypothetical protein LBP19_09050 [Treponema sp.]|jgi:hypothetical protein|nr:hypothetical protein [Treponema sp.]